MGSHLLLGQLSNTSIELLEKMAIKLGFDRSCLNHILLFAGLRDFGRIGISDQIFRKQGSLSTAEKIEMQRHPEIGYRMALAVPETAPIAEWILKHHEWWDGSGYPLGLRATEIPLECRLLGIIDAYDAMVHERAYRKALSKQEAISELRRFSGRQFDLTLTELFISLLTEDYHIQLPAGNQAELSGKEKQAVIIRDIRDWIKVSDELKRHNEYLTILHDTTLSLIDRLDLEDLLVKIISSAADLFKIPHAYLYLVDKDKQHMTMKVGVGLCEAQMGSRCGRGEGIAGKVWMNKQVLYTQPAADGEGLVQPADRKSVKAVLGVPLLIKDNISGVFGLVSTERNFTPEEIRLAQGFGELASLAINNASLYEMLQKGLNERKKLQEAVEQSPSVVIITDRKGDIEYVNAKFCQITGYSVEEVIGKNPELLNAEGLAAENNRQLWEILDAGLEWSGEFRNKKKNGEFYWARATIGPIRNLAGEITHFLSIQEDITQHKQLEEELLRKNAALTEALHELKKTQSSLIQQEKFAGIGQLAAGVAHEINNPLSFVLSNFETIQKYIGRLTEVIAGYKELQAQVLAAEIPALQEKAVQVAGLEKQKKLNYILQDMAPILQESVDGLNRVSKIVKALRFFSCEDQSGNYQEYDLNEGIRIALTMARNEVKYVADVRENLAPLPVIKVAGDQINQVLLNLIINAAHAIKSKAAATPGLITVSTYCDELYVYCAVADTGTGIPEKIRNKIFDPFFTTKPIGQGTGLGLSISYDIIVNKHNGELLVESEAGMGSTFIIKLPVS